MPLRSEIADTPPTAERNDALKLVAIGAALLVISAALLWAFIASLHPLFFEAGAVAVAMVLAVVVILGAASIAGIALVLWGSGAALWHSARRR